MLPACGAGQGHGGPNESLQSLLIQLVAFVEVDGSPDVAFETGIAVEKASTAGAMPLRVATIPNL
jgi:hypothetical protein